MKTDLSAVRLAAAPLRAARGFALLAAVLLLATAGCEPRDAPVPPAATPADAPAAAQPAAGIDPELLRRHAAAADQMVAEMREHVNFMWRLPPRDVPAHAEAHEARVVALIGTIEEQIREVERGVGMDAARMGEVMGIRADQYNLLQEEMRIARAEAAELRTATESQIRDRMRGHLDRIERILDTFEASAAHRHRVAAGGATGH